MAFPKIPDEYIRHFVRGCWDGDGTVYIEKRNGNLKLRLFVVLLSL